MKKQVARRRSPGRQRRVRQLVLRFSPDEFVTVASAAKREGMALGAWIAELACTVAADEADLPVSWPTLARELVRSRANLVAVMSALEKQAGGPQTESAIVVVSATMHRLDLFIDAAIAAGRR
jgi:hypothetical protein